ncbi:MAG: hypothetical protein GEV06_23850 [Luteitalea sp.]|nr:hypothetical protein [Luteitalea sp.]
MVEILPQDVRYAARQLRRTPGLTLAVVATLALAIGAAATLFSLWNAITLRRLPVAEPDRLVALSLADRRSDATYSIEYSTYRELATHQQVFEQLCAYSGGGVFAVEARGTLVDAASPPSRRSSSTCCTCVPCSAGSSNRRTHLTRGHS